VASIKVAGPSAPRHGRLTRLEALIETSRGLLNAPNMTLRQLIEGAYSLDNYQVTGGPEWVGSARFEVQGRLPGDANRQQLLPMLGPLLGERFRLAFHHETKELPVYVLMVAKGAKLKKHQGAEGAPLGRNRLGRNMAMADFTKYSHAFG
jgi:uncharacterized protein (TIGR03435 family)